MRLLVCGGAGFIGSNFVRFALRHWPNAHIVVLDKLTYAGNLANLAGVLADERITFIHGDICSPQVVRDAMAGCTYVVNAAAETHVDRSILDPNAFLRTNVEGVRVLLDEARAAEIVRYLQVSTDEVYGDVPAPRRASERDPLCPRSPYAASKAAGDLLVGAYHSTYGVPTLITRGANTYGPYQYPEKLLSLFITNALEGEPLPVYGDGKQVRDWLFVEDHCSGIATVLERGVPGEAYNLGAGEECANLEIVGRIVKLVGCEPDLVRHVTDRPGHDRRYALDTSRSRSIGWMPSASLLEGLEQTVRWYRERRDWWEPIRAGEFRDYYHGQYGERLSNPL